MDLFPYTHGVVLEVDVDVDGIAFFSPTSRLKFRTLAPRADRASEDEGTARGDTATGDCDAVVSFVGAIRRQTTDDGRRYDTIRVGTGRDRRKDTERIGWFVVSRWTLDVDASERTSERTSEGVR